MSLRGKPGLSSASLLSIPVNAFSFSMSDEDPYAEFLRLEQLRVSLHHAPPCHKKDLGLFGDQSTKNKDN